MENKQFTPVYAVEFYRVYSRNEVAEILDVSLSTVKRMILAGEIEISQPPDMRRVFIRGSALQKLIDETVSTIPPPDDPDHHTHRPLIEPNRVYSRTEAAQVLNISLSTVKRLIAAGHLRASQPPGMRRVFITGQAMLDFLAENVVESDAHNS